MISWGEVGQWPGGIGRFLANGNVYRTQGLTIVVNCAANDCMISSNLSVNGKALSDGGSGAHKFVTNNI